ncbi:hypothetical protein FBBAL38_07855 [Flavobacteria bacterium BAL38]|nr:hypothetical protein FBBAL38_07855 [Flavobacteria bacterium BAL38]
MNKLLLIIGILCSFNSYSQKANRFSLNPWENVNGYRFGAGFKESLELEASYLITSYPQNDPGFGGMIMRVQYIGAGLEYLRIGNMNVFGTKLSYENIFAFFSGQIASDFLFTNDSTQVRIMPKIGLSVFGYITLYYGWNLNLIKQSELQPQGHNVSLQINILN